VEARGIEVAIVGDLDDAVARADIISTATSASAPLIHGRLVRPGTHIDLVGGFRPDMQEADNELLGKARIFVDDRQSAAMAGDIFIPLQAGAIDEARIEGDLFDLSQRPAFQRGPDEITVYKNAGGAHLDLVVSQYVIARLTDASRRTPAPAASRYGRRIYHAATGRPGMAHRERRPAMRVSCHYGLAVGVHDAADLGRLFAHKSALARSHPRHRFQRSHLQRCDRRHDCPVASVRFNRADQFWRS
jgi:hypothetical protein